MKQSTRIHIQSGPHSRPMAVMLWHDVTFYLLSTHILGEACTYARVLSKGLHSHASATAEMHASDTLKHKPALAFLFVADIMIAWVKRPHVVTGILPPSVSPQESNKSPIIYMCSLSVVM